MSAQKREFSSINYLSGIVAILAVIAMAAVGILSETPPQPLATDAPAGEFSAARAMATLQQIAHEPHATGTKENAQVRNYLIEQLRSLGLNPQIQSGLGFNKKRGSVAVVHNILVRVPGTLPGKALLVAAHYDSVSAGPGAGDDGASVAAILETLRALKSAQPLQNDLICLFTDGEESGLLGSELFVTDTSRVKDIGLVLNYEFRGNRGPILMFETSTGNAQLIAGLATAVDQAVANSLLYEVYKLMPNDTDFTNFKNAGIPGMNFAAIDGAASYHTQLDRPELLNVSTLQHEGNMMLPLIRYFGNVPLKDLQTSDRVYFNSPKAGLISYPVSWVFPLCFIVTALFFAVSVMAIKRADVRISRVLAGALLFVFLMTIFAAFCQLLWMTAVWLHPVFDSQYEPYNSTWYLIAFVCLVAGLFVFIELRLIRWIMPTELGYGAVLCWILLLIASSLFLPGASFILTWPLLPVLVSYGLLCSRRISQFAVDTKMWILLAGITPAVVFYAPLIHMLFIGLSPRLSLTVGLAVTLLLGIMAPLLALLGRRFLLPALPLFAGITFLMGGLLTVHFDADHPRPDNVFYALDGNTGKALWLSGDTELDSWSRQIFLQAPLRRSIPEIFGAGPNEKRFWTTPAPDVGIKEPIIKVLQDSVINNVRIVRVNIRSARSANRIHVGIEGGEVINSRVQGQDYTSAPKERWRLLAQGMPDNEVTIDFQIKSGQPFQLRVYDETYGLSQFTLPARSPEFIAEMNGTFSDTIIAAQVRNFN